MNGIATVALTVCCASLICALVSNFVSDQSIKRVLNLVLGAFVVCSLFFPVRAAVNGIKNGYDELTENYEAAATFDEAAYNAQIVAQTRKNLEQTLTAILNQNGIYPQKTEIILSIRDDNSIIILQARIYIDKGCTQTGLISQLTIHSFGIEPNIITEQDEND
jgi:hypothetical protein